MPGSSIEEKGAYLRDAVFAANDGIITTFAIVAGSEGARFPVEVVLVLGISNLLADGFSMASGNYLGVKSEVEYDGAFGKKNKKGFPVGHGTATFVAFVLAGITPLIPFLMKIENPFPLSLLFVILALFGIGLLRGAVSKQNVFRKGVEQLFVGGFAALVAYFVGYFVEGFVS